MFSNLDLDDFINLGRIAGIVLFVIALLLPGVHMGAESYEGIACAGWTLYGTVAFFGSLFGPDGPNGFALFFMISGWIAPLVAVGMLIDSDKTKRVIAMALPGLMLAPWVVFAWHDSGWASVSIHPLIGHYVWTVGCLLIFTPSTLRCCEVISQSAGNASTDQIVKIEYRWRYTCRLRELWLRPLIRSAGAHLARHQI